MGKTGNHNSGTRIPARIIFRETEAGKGPGEGHINVSPLHVHKDLSINPCNETCVLQNTPENFQGGKIKHYATAWKSITSDPWVLQTVQGYRIEFEDFPSQSREIQQLSFTAQEQTLVDEEVTKLLDKNVIQKVQRQSGDFISNIFIRPKRMEQIGLFSM